MELSKENIEKIVWGGVYTALGTDVEKYYSKYTDRLNDQKYGWWIPTHYKKDEKEHYYMIDTYQISSNLFKNQYNTDKQKRFEALIEGLEKLKDPEDGGNYASSMPYNYYYSAIIKLTDKNFDIFKLKADLHQYRLTNEDECRYYNEDDVIKYVQLYNEHNYPRGIIIAKKEAKINYKNKINAKLYDIKKDIDKPTFCSDYYIEQLLELEREAIAQSADYDKKQLQATIKYNNFMKQLNKIANAFYDEIKDDLYNYSD